jgi:hydroxymethylbilane synthase
MFPPERLVIATRESALALWQARHIRDRLLALYPQCQVELLGMTTQGDQILDRPLAAIGGKGLFIKELEVAMEQGRADLAVHSLKDVPMVMPDGFALAAITEREDPRDAFVSNRYANLAELPQGAVVGTSSLRREAQLRARYPHIVIEALRGNVGTRLRKLDEGRYDAIILAAAGLKRLGEGARITALLDPAESVPAPGQAALGIECRTEREDVKAALAPLHDLTTAACVTAERAFSRALGGSCHTPLGGYAHMRGERLHLTGLLASRDGSRVLREEAIGAPADAEHLGLLLAARLREQGADALLQANGNA